MVTNKSDKKIPYRLEIKSLEVRDMSVYRLLRDLQLIHAALFAFYDRNGDHFLDEQWTEMSKELRHCFPEIIHPTYFLKTDVPVEEREQMRKVLLPVLHHYTRAIKKLLR